MKKTINLETSKSGISCLWECGGGYSNTGTAQVITDANGYPNWPLFVRTHGDLACGNHALIPVHRGDHIVTVDRHRDKVTIRVEEITSINGNTATIEDTGKKICMDAINATIEKTYCYHCREPYYIAVQNPSPAPIAPSADDDFYPDNDEILLYEEEYDND